MSVRRPLDGPFSIPWLRVAGWLGLIFVLFPGYFSDAFRIVDFFDEHHFLNWEEANRISVVEHGQIAAWNPYWCGGTVGIAAPEDSFFGPDSWLQFALGVSMGRRANILLLFVLGLEGTFRLSRLLGASSLGAIFSALIAASSERILGFAHDGWLNFLTFHLLPWVLYCYIRGEGRHGYRLLGGVFLAWMLLAAGTYALPYTLLALILFIAASLISRIGARQSLKPPLASVFWMGLVALGLACVKLVPMMLYLHQFPRVFLVSEVNAPAQLFTALLVRYDWVLLLASVAAVVHRRGVRLLGAAGFFFICAMGVFHPLAPFSILKQLPFFSQLRSPERYMVMVVFFLALGAGLSITAIEDGLPNIARRLWAWARPFALKRFTHLAASAPRLLLAVISIASSATIVTILRKPTEAHLTALQVPVHSVFNHDPPRAMAGQPFRQARGNRRDGHLFPPLNLGSLTCVSGIPVPESPLLRADLAQEEYPKDPAVASVQRVSWSPHKIKLRVVAAQATTIYVNQNWDSHWTSNVGTVRQEQMLLAIDVPKGEYYLVVSYVDRVIQLCILIALATLAGLGAIFTNYSARILRRTHGRFLRLPWLPQAAAAATSETTSGSPTDS